MPPRVPPRPPQLALLELNFLPTTGTKLTKQQLILARECRLPQTPPPPEMGFSTTPAGGVAPP